MPEEIVRGEPKQLENGNTNFDKSWFIIAKRIFNGKKDTLGEDTIQIQIMDKINDLYNYSET